LKADKKISKLAQKGVLNNAGLSEDLIAVNIIK